MDVEMVSGLKVAAFAVKDTFRCCARSAVFQSCSSSSLDLHPVSCISSAGRRTRICRDETVPELRQSQGGLPIAFADKERPEENNLLLVKNVNC